MAKKGVKKRASKKKGVPSEDVKRQNRIISWSIIILSAILLPIFIFVTGMSPVYQSWFIFLWLFPLILLVLGIFMLNHKRWAFYAIGIFSILVIIWSLSKLLVYPIGTWMKVETFITGLPLEILFLVLFILLLVNSFKQLRLFDANF